MNVSYNLRMGDFLAARRLVHLMQILEQQDRKARGAKKRAALKLGLSETYASKSDTQARARREIPVARRQPSSPPCSRQFRSITASASITPI